MTDEVDKEMKLARQRLRIAEREAGIEDIGIATGGGRGGRGNAGRLAGAAGRVANQAAMHRAYETRRAMPQFVAFKNWENKLRELNSELGYANIARSNKAPYNGKPMSTNLGKTWETCRRVWSHAEATVRKLKQKVYQEEVQRLPTPQC